MFSRTVGARLLSSIAFGAALVGLQTASVKANPIECQLNLDPPLGIPECAQQDYTVDDTTVHIYVLPQNDSAPVLIPVTFAFSNFGSQSVNLTFPGDPAGDDIPFSYWITVDPPSHDAFSAIYLDVVDNTPNDSTDNIVQKVIYELTGFNADPNTGETIPVYDPTPLATISNGQSFSLFPSRPGITRLYIEDIISPGSQIVSYTNRFVQYTQTPALLPLLGAGAAFGFSRRLRRRTRQAVSLG